MATRRRKTGQEPRRGRRGATAGALFTLVFGALFAAWEVQRAATLTATTTAEILSSRSSYHAGPNIERPHHTTAVRFRYVVDGRTIEKVQTEEGAYDGVFPEGQPAKVCYKPAQPEVADVIPLRGNCPPLYRLWTRHPWQHDIWRRLR